MFEITRLITSGNRGIGRSFVETYLSRPNTTVITSIRDVASATKFIDAKPATDAAEAVEELKTKHDVAKIDVSISNAEYMGSIAPILQVSLDAVCEHFELNIFGHLKVIRAFYALLQASKEPNFLVLSSVIGSIANRLVRKLHFENPKLTSMAFNPGWVQSNIGTDAAQGIGTDGAPVTVEESVGNLVKLFDGTSREKSGTFTGYNRGTIP